MAGAALPWTKACMSHMRRLHWRLALSPNAPNTSPPLSTPAAGTVYLWAPSAAQAARRFGSASALTPGRPRRRCERRLRRVRQRHPSSLPALCGWSSFLATAVLRIASEAHSAALDLQQTANWEWSLGPSRCLLVFTCLLVSARFCSTVRRTIANPKSLKSKRIGTLRPHCRCRPGAGGR